MSRPTARVLTLLELLQSGGIRTVAELADRLGVEGRTVRRYVDHLIDLDVPVESVRGRYGGYRLAPGYRLPPLMLSDDEALAVLLGLVAGRRAGLTTATGTASETASAKIRRVLPKRHRPPARRRPGIPRLHGPARRVRHPGRRGPAHHRRCGAPPPTGLDPLHRPRRPAQRTHAARVRDRRPFGPVVRHGHGPRDRRGPNLPARPHRRREDPARLIRGARRVPIRHSACCQGSPRPPYRHEVTLRIHGTVEQIRARLPASVASLEEHEPAAGQDRATERWLRVELRAERLDWLPPVLASLDRPFVIERPDELRDLVVALADRLASYARQA